MILFPAIDIKNGECVRLRLGDIQDSKIYNSNPLSQAKKFQEIGFEWVHIVDLDAAVNGQSKNKPIIEEIIKKTKLKVQLGGGIRTIEMIDHWLSLGAKKIVLGTISITNISLVKEVANKYPQKIVLALDSKDDFICIEGWKKQTGVNIFDLIKEYDNTEIDSILHTDINRDGMLEGLNFKGSKKLAMATNISVILSGGLKSIEDIKKLKKNDNSIFKGAIIGKALYEKKIDPTEALKIINSEGQ